MNNVELLNGLAAIRETIYAFNELENDIINHEIFELAACNVLNAICLNNKAISNMNSKIYIPNYEKSIFKIGDCGLSLPRSQKLVEILYRYIPNSINNGLISIPLNIDVKSQFSILIEIEDDAKKTMNLSQHLLISKLQYDENVNFKCVDMTCGGDYFSDVITLIKNNHNASCRKISKTLYEFDDLINELDQISSKNIFAVGSSKFKTINEYNDNEKIKIEKYINILNISDLPNNTETLKKLKLLIDNKNKNGMSFIIIGNKNVLQKLSCCEDLYLKYYNDQITAGKESNVFISSFIINKVPKFKVDEIASKLQQSKMIDTTYGTYFGKEEQFFSMDSTKLIRIPFAVDNNKIVQNFEIGGEAPTHALISGSTGSGKSVALHTLIMQIIKNYHPDDVEIWAIDYKAVEFDWYTKNKTPHFRVIAHDTSTEFSLSLLDLLYEEYENRMKKFLEVGVKNISEYRNKMGKYSMTRIIVFLDEFQIMTQAVQNYTGNKDYRTVLENLLKLTRAMGISFVLCSQTIASGLSGLTESARDQIGCRLCLKHDDDNEIRESLMLSGVNTSEIVNSARNLRKGQCIYKKTNLEQNVDQDKEIYEFQNLNILYLNDNVKKQIIEKVNELTFNNCISKDEIIIRGSGRIAISEKSRHPMQKFIANGKFVYNDSVDWYPAAPTTLADCLHIELSDISGSNVLLVGENYQLFESVMTHSIGGFLMNKNNRIVINIIDESHKKPIIKTLQSYKTDRITFNIGIEKSLKAINELKQVRPNYQENLIFIWYGLEKLKNEIFLLSQDGKKEVIENKNDTQEKPRLDILNDLMQYLSEITDSGGVNNNVEDKPENINLTYDECKSILKQAFDVGPENKQYHIVVFNNNKSLKKTGLIDLSSFDNRIGSRMSTDDSYDLFGTSLAINKTDDDTLIYYAGNGPVIPIRPYLMPDSTWFDDFNKQLNEK